MNLCRLIFVTGQAMAKIVDGGEFDVAKRTVAATKLSEGDRLVSVIALRAQHQIVLRTHEGYLLKFAIEEIPEKKKAAIGVRAMKLADKDYIEEVYYLTPGMKQSVIPYKEKEYDLAAMKLNKRDAKGVKPRV